MNGDGSRKEGFLLGESASLLVLVALFGLFASTVIETIAYAVVARYRWGMPMPVFGTVDTLGRSLHLLGTMLWAPSFSLFYFGCARLVARAAPGLVHRGHKALAGGAATLKS